MTWEIRCKECDLLILRNGIVNASDPLAYWSDIIINDDGVEQGAVRASGRLRSCHQVFLSNRNQTGEIANIAAN